MSRTATIMFRNQEVDLEYIDHGYEPDTNAHEIEWWLVEKDKTLLDMTDEEQQAIDEQVFEIAQDYHYTRDDWEW